MGAFGIGHWLIVIIVLVVLFGGRGRVSSVMEDFGKGIQAFKKGLRSDDHTEVRKDASSDADKSGPAKD